MTNLIPFTPFNNGVIIEAPTVESENKLSSGVVLPDGMKASDYEKKEFEGYKVIGVGPTCIQVKVGDVVMFNANAQPDGFVFKGKEYVVFREHHVVVINNSKEELA